MTVLENKMQLYLKNPINNSIPRGYMVISLWFVSIYVHLYSHYSNHSRQNISALSLAMVSLKRKPLIYTDLRSEVKNIGSEFENTELKIIVIFTQQLSDKCC